MRNNKEKAHFEEKRKEREKEGGEKKKKRKRERRSLALFVEFNNRINIFSILFSFYNLWALNLGMITTIIVVIYFL
jgi:hypothetical protein